MLREHGPSLGGSLGLHPTDRLVRLLETQRMRPSRFSGSGCHIIARVLNSSGEQTHLLDLLVRNTTPRGSLDVEAGVTYGHFLDTRPPVFTKAEHPLEADEWIRTIKQKFRLLPQDGVCGPATSWTCWHLVGQFYGHATFRCASYMGPVQNCL